VLSLFDAAGFDADLGSPVDQSFALTMNIENEEDVDRTVEEMVVGGATILKEPQIADFGGCHAYLSDPAGVIWEIAYNPGWSVEDDGTVNLEPVDPS